MDCAAGAMTAPITAHNAHLRHLVVDARNLHIGEVPVDAEKHLSPLLRPYSKAPPSRPDDGSFGVISARIFRCGSIEFRRCGRYTCAMHKYFSPRWWKNQVLSALAKALRPHLARQPLVWGDPARLHVGANVHLVDAVINLRSGTVTIEDAAFFGHGVMLLTGKHAMRKRGIQRHDSVPESGRDIIVRQGAWVASGAIVLGPCDIGEDAVIAAGSVVTGVIPAGAVYSGNPARLASVIQFDSVDVTK
jgi:acetyltransferase-like isoleucine patch superfamily enzyme